MVPLGVQLGALFPPRTFALLFLFAWAPAPPADARQSPPRSLGRAAGRGALLPLPAEVGVADRVDGPPRTFSAGMRKRLALARVLRQPASVFRLDEPYGQLDPPGFRLV